MEAGSGKPRRILPLALGVALVLFGLAAVFGLPFSRSEFDYAAQPQWPRALAFNGFTLRDLWSSVARTVLLGAGCFCLARGLPRAAFDERSEGNWVGRLLWPVLQPRLAPVLAALAVALVAGFIFHGIPIVDDEATYRMQADLFAQGRLFDPPVPRVLQWHREPFTIFTPTATTGKYLFGAPLILVPGVWLGMPALMHVLLAAATVVVLRAQLQRAVMADPKPSHERFPLVAAALLAVSPAFIFTTATLQSQAAALFCLAVFVWALTVRTTRAGLIAGLAMGFCVATRPQLAVPCGAALLLLYMRATGWRFWAAALAGALPFAVAIAAYNHAISGDAFLLPGAFYSDERYGFGAIQSVGDGYEHTPLKAIGIALSALWRLNGWGLGWPLSLAGPIAWAVLGRPRWLAVKPWAVIAGATFLFQAGYFFIGVVETGPVYHYAAVPFFAVSTAAAIDAALRYRRPGFVAFVAVSFAVGTTSFFVEQGRRLSLLADAIEAPMRVRNDARLVFLERSIIGGNPAGTVRGVPFRVRRPDGVSYFPRPTVDAKTGNIPAADALRKRHAEGSCAYVYFDRKASEYVSASCDEMARIGRAFDEAEPPWF